MAKHLEELQLSKEAQNFIIKLNSWLAQNGLYKPAADMKYFDECVSEGVVEEIIPLGDDVVKSITKAPKYYGIARPKDQDQGGWLFNPHEQCLISVRVSKGASPYISDEKKTPVFFPPGKAVYCAPNQPVFVSGGVELVCIHWVAR